VVTQNKLDVKYCTPMQHLGALISLDVLKHTMKPFKGTNDGNALYTTENSPFSHKV